MATMRPPVGEPVVVTRLMDASPQAVWDLVSDLPRMGEWSPENKGGQWVGGATQAAVGAEFRGRNSNGKKSWRTKVLVTQCDPVAKISFSLMVAGSRWCDWVYELAPSGTGTLVTHSWIDRRSGFADKLGGLISGVKDRGAHNRKNMEATLEALAHGS